MSVIMDQRKVELDGMEHVCRALEQALAWEVPEESWARKASSIRFLARSLQGYLERVFAVEEHDGYMTALVEEHPERSLQVADLRKEHNAIRKLARDVLYRLDGTWISECAHVQAAYDDLTLVLDRVRRHHGEENRLLQNAVLQDTGGEG